MDKKQFEGKNIAILGFWLEGKSTLNFLLNNNFSFNKLSVLDVKNQPELESMGISFETWEHYLEHLGEFDVIFKSAGIPYSEPLKQYQDRIITQVQFFFNNYKGKVIAVTASKWKSTMTSLVYTILKNAGLNVKLVWNIWTPFLDEIDFKQEYDYVVCELSSYMLERLEKKNFISVLGNIFPEHMDWHGWFDQYANAKLNILKWSEINFVLQKTVDEYELLEQYDNIETYGINWKTSWANGYFIHDNQELFPTEDKLLIWEHNIQNISLAIGVALRLWVSIDVIHETVKNFRGLPHRLELVWEYNWITFYDDAISTTPESTLEALKSFWKRVDTIFLWGTNRGYDFKELMNKVQEYEIDNIVFFPPSWEIMERFLEDYTGKILRTDRMEDAVAFAFVNTKKWKICLLSTASPSYSVWKNFEEKWDLYKKAIQELAPQFNKQEGEWA